MTRLASSIASLSEHAFWSQQPFCASPPIDPALSADKDSTALPRSERALSTSRAVHPRDHTFFTSTSSSFSFVSTPSPTSPHTPALAPHLICELSPPAAAPSHPSSSSGSLIILRNQAELQLPCGGSNRAGGEGGHVPQLVGGGLESQLLPPPATPGLGKSSRQLRSREISRPLLAKPPKRPPATFAWCCLC